MSAKVQGQEKQIQIVYGGNFTKDEVQFPGASIFSKDDKQVQFRHQGADLWCDIAIFYPAENKIRAKGNIVLIQGDSIFMNAGQLDYNGVSQLAKAWESKYLNIRYWKVLFDPKEIPIFESCRGGQSRIQTALTTARLLHQLKECLYVRALHDIRKGIYLLL